MYKNYLIVASKQDKAGVSITTSLSQFGGFNFHLVEGSVLHKENLEDFRLSQFEFIIFASKHESEKKEKTLSIHIPGNTNENAEFGGEPNKICPGSALFNKQLFQNLKEIAKEHQLDEKYQITLECTHHGPLINKPCVFIEIGSTETEWEDRRAAFVIAKTIKKTVETFKENPYNEVAVGIGGSHYCPNFNKIQANSNIALAHIIPQYSLPLNEAVLKETLEKTQEEVDFALLDWKGLGNAEQRKQVIDLLEKNYISWKKISKVSN